MSGSLSVFELNVSLCLIILGWVIVHVLAQIRDTTKGRKELVVKTADALSEQVNKLVLLGITYHTEAQRNNSLEIELNSGLKDLSAQLSQLNLATRPKRSNIASDRFHRVFKKAMTGAHYEDEHTGKLMADDKQLGEIAAAGLDLRGYLVAIKFEQFT